METQPMTTQERQRIYSKKYREANRDAILAKQAENRKLTRKCSCGEIVNRNNYSHHSKWKKHLRLLQDQAVIKEDDDVPVNTTQEIKEEAIQGEPIEEPLLEITEEEMSLLVFWPYSKDDILCITL